MTTETLQEAQEYLTVINNQQVKKIIDVVPLLKRHPPESVISFLDTLYKEKEQRLKDLLSNDKTNSKINETIAAMFRLHMAIKTIEREEEVIST